MHHECSSAKLGRKLAGDVTQGVEIYYVLSETTFARPWPFVYTVSSNYFLLNEHIFASGCESEILNCIR